MKLNTDETIRVYRTRIFYLPTKRYVKLLQPSTSIDEKSHWHTDMTALDLKLSVITKTEIFPIAFKMAAI